MKTIESKETKPIFTKNPFIEDPQKNEICDLIIKRLCTFQEKTNENN